MNILSPEDQTQGFVHSPPPLIRASSLRILIFPCEAGDDNIGIAVENYSKVKQHPVTYAPSSALS